MKRRQDFSSVADRKSRAAAKSSATSSRAPPWAATRKRGGPKHFRSRSRWRWRTQAATGGATGVVNLSFPTVDSRVGKPLSPRHGTGGRCPVRLSTSAWRSQSGGRRPERGRGPI